MVLPSLRICLVHGGECNLWPTDSRQVASRVLLVMKISSPLLVSEIILNLVPLDYAPAAAR
jgi:hypothetical protein